MQAIREFNDLPDASDEVLRLLPSHFYYATSVVRPSAMREMALEVPQVSILYCFHYRSFVKFNTNI